MKPLQMLLVLLFGLVAAQASAHDLWVNAVAAKGGPVQAKIRLNAIGEQPRHGPGRRGDLDVGAGDNAVDHGRRACNGWCSRGHHGARGGGTCSHPVIVSGPGVRIRPLDRMRTSFTPWRKPQLRGKSIIESHDSARSPVRRRALPHRIRGGRSGSRRLGGGLTELDGGDRRCSLSYHSPERSTSPRPPKSGR